MNLASFKLCLIRSNSDRPVTHALRECDKGLSQEDFCCGDLLSSPVCLPRLDRPLVTRLGASGTVSPQPFNNNQRDQWVKGAINRPQQIR